MSLSILASFHCGAPSSADESASGVGATNGASATPAPNRDALPAACTTDMDCDDGNPYTTDRCSSDRAGEFTVRTCAREPIPGCGSDAGTSPPPPSSADAAIANPIDAASDARHFQWVIGAWGVCVQPVTVNYTSSCTVKCGDGIQNRRVCRGVGAQTRSIHCVDASGHTVANSFCGVTPPTSQACGTAGCTQGTQACSMQPCQGYCSPLTVCPAGACGLISNSCGGLLDCGSCGAQSSTPSCVPITSCPSGACGSIWDGCGGSLNCGACATQPQTSACVPITSCPTGGCGVIGNGCGGTLDCGTCPTQTKTPPPPACENVARTCTCQRWANTWSGFYTDCGDLTFGTSGSMTVSGSNCPTFTSAPYTVDCNAPEQSFSSSWTQAAGTAQPWSANCTDCSSMSGNATLTFTPDNGAPACTATYSWDCH